MATQRNHEFRKGLIKFGISVIKLTKTLPRNTESDVITRQVIRSATSIGANYTESMFALSKPDFIHCLNICKKEAGETLHWLELLAELNPKNRLLINECMIEAQSYLKIFISSIKTAQKRSSNLEYNQ